MRVRYAQFVFYARREVRNQVALNRAFFYIAEIMRHDDVVERFRIYARIVNGRSGRKESKVRCLEGFFSVAAFLYAGDVLKFSNRCRGWKFQSATAFVIEFVKFKIRICSLEQRNIRA